MVASVAHGQKEVIVRVQMIVAGAMIVRVLTTVVLDQMTVMIVRVRMIVRAVTEMIVRVQMIAVRHQMQSV
jgi:hypothetical protein